MPHYTVYLYTQSEYTSKLELFAAGLLSFWQERALIYTRCTHIHSLTHAYLSSFLGSCLYHFTVSVASFCCYLAFVA